MRWEGIFKEGELPLVDFAWQCYLLLSVAARIATSIFVHIKAVSDAK